MTFDSDSKKYIFDTTYILPLFGIKIDFDNSFIREIEFLWTNGIENVDLILPTICLLESLYKLNRVYRQKKDFSILSRYSLILPTITKNPKINMFDPIQDQLSSGYALRLRNKGHTDLMDCLITATAWRLEGILITEDKEIAQSIKKLPTENQFEIKDWKSFRLECKMQI